MTKKEIQSLSKFPFLLSVGSGAEFHVPQVHVSHFQRPGV